MIRSTSREFTGLHMAVLTISCFAVVVIVNFVMAYSATSSFAGLVVENSYVESQHFNEKLEAMRRQAALNWKVGVAVSEDAVVIDARDADGRPLRAAVDVEMTRPTTDNDDHMLHAGAGSLSPMRLPTRLAAGSWDVTVAITDNEGRTYLATRRVILAGGRESAK